MKLLKLIFLLLKLLKINILSEKLATEKIIE